MKEVEEMMKENEFARYPRLDTVLMVEKFIEEHSGEFKVYQLWKNLPKKTMYQTYKVIIVYLLDINKIAVDSEGKIGYIWSPEAGQIFKKKGVKWE